MIRIASVGMVVGLGFVMTAPASGACGVLHDGAHQVPGNPIVAAGVLRMSDQLFDSLRTGTTCTTEVALRLPPPPGSAPARWTHAPEYYTGVMLVPHAVPQLSEHERRQQWNRGKEGERPRRPRVPNFDLMVDSRD